jgi:tRNA A-37 threonylcarbamoyl transferase component Bud32
MLNSAQMAIESSSIIKACPACGTAVDTTAAEPLARVTCPQCGEKIRAERSFDHFVLLETLGVGGMGTVYKARDTSLDRLVALKVLRKNLAGENNHTSRLQQEARAAAAVNHPYVVQVLSSGTDHGQFYVVMELVDHGSLDDLIEQRKRLPEEQVLQCGIQVAKGLRAAYRKRLIHRDVKPANILFVDEQTAKIGDFGLAGVAVRAAEARGIVWGTPYYVAPERLNNDPEDFRSDIYSLGATLFHAISGKAPIECDTNSTNALRDLKKRPLDLHTIVPEVSDTTAGVFQRMIAPEPWKRFDSYDELIKHLNGAYRSLTDSDSTGLAARPRRLPWKILIILAVLIATAVPASYWLVHKAREHAAAEARLAELNRQYDEARRQLIAGKLNVARTSFAQIADDARNLQPLYDWARMHEALAALVARDMSETRQALRAIGNAGQAAFKKKDANLANFFFDMARTFLATGIVPADTGDRVDTSNFAAFALLLFALEDLEHHDITDATSLLEQFIRAQPTGKFAWVAEYKPLAQKYLDDCRLFTAWKNQPVNTGTSAELSTALTRLRDLKAKLKTDSALADDLTREEEALASRAAQPKVPVPRKKRP